MELVHLETIFISCLVARPSRDLLIAAHQQVTQSWWEHRQDLFENYVSQVVIDEASIGDPSEIQKRLAILENLKPLDVTHEAEELVVEIMAAGMLSSKAIRDAAHVAVAAVHEMDYLLTWNCKHLANAQIARTISLTCQQHGYRMPIFCTPEELMGE